MHVNPTQVQGGSLEAALNQLAAVMLDDVAALQEQLSVVQCVALEHSNLRSSSVQEVPQYNCGEGARALQRWTVQKHTAWRQVSSHCKTTTHTHQHILHAR